MKTRLLLSALCGAAWLTLSSAAHAITDPAGDFLPSYTGSRNGDLDVIGAIVTYDAATGLFDFTATLDAPVATTPTASYVWGIDRGQGTQRFNTGTNPIGAGVSFDAVVVFALNGSATVNRIVGGGSTVLANDVRWSGDTITGSVSASLLPSLGLAPDDYTWNLWPRDGSVAGSAAISDFAPDASNAAVTPVPEPASCAFFAAGLLLLAASARRRNAS